MVRVFILLLLGCGLLGLSGCAMPQQQNRLELDLAEMKRRLALAEQDLAAMKRAQESGAKADDFSQLSRRQADLQADFDVFRGEFQSLAGQLDLQANRTDALETNLKSLQEEVALKQKALEERFQPRLGSSGSSPLEPEGKPMSRPPTPSALKKSSTAPKESVSQRGPVTEEDTLYRQALDAIRKENDFPKGREFLERFVRQNPEDPLVVNARYWIGEAWYGEKKYENAILQFQDVIQDYGDHPKVAAALLKQALAFQALGDSANSKILLGKVVERFPSTEEAKKAEERLGKLD